MITLEDILISGKLGDGCFVKKHKSSYFQTVSKNIDYLDFKRSVIRENGILSGRLNVTRSGYNKNKHSYNFSTVSDPKIGYINDLSISEAIKKLTKNGLILYYLDDGSLHKHKEFINLYCNTFSIEEINLLIEKIWSFYPIKVANILWDRKKDGRKYPYLYVSCTTARVFCEDVKHFLIKHNIISLLYKVKNKKNLPSTTIESRLLD